MSRSARGGTLPPYPRVCPCRHCGLAVLRDNDDHWIHASLSYACRDRWGRAYGTTAEPTPSALVRTAATGRSGPESGSLAWGDGSDTV
ncbi:hypothetical protein ABGB07_02570 [Micromonosporaceae bacterium B7E4]